MAKFEPFLVVPCPTERRPFTAFTRQTGLETGTSGREVLILGPLFGRRCYVSYPLSATKRA